MYDLLVDAATRSPIAGNEGGSLLTMKSNLGLLFGGATIASGTAGVFCDQGYWQRAIASRPQSTTRAYFLGGISWFAIPWGESTSHQNPGRRLILSFRHSHGAVLRGLDHLAQLPHLPLRLVHLAAQCRSRRTRCCCHAHGYRRCCRHLGCHLYGCHLRLLCRDDCRVVRPRVRCDRYIHQAPDRQADRLVAAHRPR